MFVSYIHSFRAIAILTVIATHALDALNWPGPSWIRRLLLSGFENGTVLFVLVAGFLFQHLSARFAYRRYLGTKARYVLLPYVIWSVPIFIYDAVYGQHTFSGHPTIAEAAILAARALVTGDHMAAPFWFMPFITVVYVAAPLLLAIDRHPRLYWLCAPLLVMATFCHRPVHLTDLGQALLYFGPVYVVGMWLAHERERVLRFAERYLVLLLGLFAIMTWIEVFVVGRGGAIYSIAPFSTEAGVVDLNLACKLVGSLVLLVILRRADRVVAGRLAFFADISFGLFFVHAYVLMLIAHIGGWLGFRDGLPGGSRDFFLVTVSASLGAIVIVWTLKRLLGTRSRYVVGC